MSTVSRILVSPLSRSLVARCTITAPRVQSASVQATRTATPFSGIVRLLISTLTVFTLASSIQAQNVGDYILPEKTSSAGRVTNRYWPKGASKLWGTDSSSLPQSITIGSGLTLSAGTLSSSSGSSTLAALTDVTLSSPANNQLLRYNSASSKWVNWTPNFLTSSDLSPYLTTAAAATTYQPLDADLTAIAALVTTVHGRSLLTGANAAATLAAIGLSPDDDLSINNVVAGGTVSAALFSGPGGGLTGLDGGQITAASIPNSALVNSSMTINGTVRSLGDSFSISVSPGGSSGDVQYNNGGTFGGVSGITLTTGALNRLTATGGTVTSSAPLYSGTQTWNAGAQVFHAFDVNITSTNGSTHAAGSTLQRWMIGSGPVLSIASNTTTGNDASNWRLVFGSDASIGWSASWGAVTIRNAANSAAGNLRAGLLQATSGVFGTNYVSLGTGSEGDVQLSSASWRGAGLRMRNTGTITWTTGTDSTSAAAAIIDIGTGSPESVVTAPVGSIFIRTDGGAGSTLYVKESGTGNTGWVAK